MALKIVFVDGFDVTSGSFKMLQKYPQSVTTFLQSGMAAGATAGQSLELINAAFGEMNLTAIIGSNLTIAGHFNFRWATTGSPTHPPGMEFFNLALGSQKLFALQQRTDGGLDVMTYHLTSPVLLGSPTVHININTWYTLEFRVTFGVSGSWSIRINGVEPVGGSDTSINFGLNLPDRASFHFVGFGNPNLRLDNYVLACADPSGSIPDDFSDGHIGPCAVVSLYPIADLNKDPGTLAWVRNTGTDNYKVVQDLPPGFGGSPTAVSPDGEASYLKNLGSGASAYFQMLKPDCFGRVLAVAANANAKPVTGSPLLNMLARLNHINIIPGPPTLHNTGTTIPGFDSNMTGYATYQAISDINPEAGVLWTDGAIGEAAWGLGAELSSIEVHVSQFYLEKVVTLLNRSFECGGLGSYAI